MRPRGYIIVDVVREVVAGDGAAMVNAHSAGARSSRRGDVDRVMIFRRWSGEFWVNACFGGG